MINALLILIAVLAVIVVIAGVGVVLWSVKLMSGIFKLTKEEFERPNTMWR